MVKLNFCGKTFAVNRLSEATMRQMRPYMTQADGGTPIAISPDDITSFAEVRGDAESVALHKAVSEALLPDSIIPFHASAIEYRGRAYLFTAPSGTGKSTHTRLWRERFGAEVQHINDDKPFLQFTPEGILVWGSPWSGKEELQSNRCAPLNGIVVLHQSPENQIRTLSPQEAFPLLLRQTYLYRDVSRRLQVTALIHRLSRERLFSLGCTPTQEAVNMSFKTLVI